MSDIPHIDVAELMERRDEITLVDVRSPGEYEDAHVPGAKLIPLPDLPERLDEWPEGEVHVICRSGARSLTACEFMAEHGRRAVNIAGGTDAWIQAGEAVITGAESS